MSQLWTVGLGKDYPGVTALGSISLTFNLGTIHSVVGENGAGKSTLMKLLSGLEKPTRGHIEFDGRRAQLDSVHDALRNGIVLVHQELNLVDTLTVAENIALGQEFRRGFVLDRRKATEQAEQLLARVGANFRPGDLVGDLSIAQKQMVEIAKALSHRAMVLILDEPTAVLSDTEKRHLYEVIHRAKADGQCVILISHLLPEVLDHSDRISVLRDGNWVGDFVPRETTEAKLVEAMVGRPLSETFPSLPESPASPPVLEVADLSVGDLVKGVNFSIRPGEILGLAGLVGSGRTEVCEALFGLRPAKGSVRWKGEGISGWSVQARAEAGMAYVSEDRKGRGVHVTLPIQHNLSLVHLKEFGRWVTNRGRETEAAEKMREKTRLKATQLSAPVSSLSGGNQQKVALGKWLMANPDLLILDEPTRGIDIGAKKEVYDIMVALAAEGKAILLVTSELPEIIGLCHRVVVLKQGRQMAELSPPHLSQEEIMTHAAGGKSE